MQVAAEFKSFQMKIQRWNNILWHLLITYNQSKDNNVDLKNWGSNFYDRLKRNAQ